MSKKKSATVAPLPEVRVVPIGSVRPAPSNPRVIPSRAVEAVARSLAEFGWQQPLVVDGNGEILAGHTRLLAAKSLGLAEVPVVDSKDLTPEQARAFRIVDNRSGDYTTWDYPTLANEIEALGDDFSEVLGVADWAAIMADFSASTFDHGLDETVPEGFDLVVTFPSKRAALEATEAIFALGANDVRHKLR